MAPTDSVGQNRTRTTNQTERKSMKSKLAGQENSMNTRRLTATTAIAIVALAACLLVRPAAASLDNPVTRPVKVIEGHLMIVIDPQTGEYQFTDWAWATHVGLALNSGAGVLDLSTGQFISGSGVITAANGDTLSWVVGTTPNTIVYTGGTGRFEGVTGGLLVVVTSQAFLSSNEDGTLTFLMTYTGEGTITY
jgi:hypothetical protein